MIRIVNISPEDAGNLGENLYEVGINNYPAITTFTHVRSDGLAACLTRAAVAVGQAEHERKMEIMKALPGELK